jgi:hypothetical protein
VCIVYLAIILIRNNGDPLAFVVVGDRFLYGEPGGSEGYDGQFAYYIAQDPLGAADKLDVSAYRYQRILYPLLARLLAFGNSTNLPWSLLLINVVALVAGTLLMEILLTGYGVSRWYALVYGLYAGQLMSVRLDLNEPLSNAFVLASLLALERKRLGISAFLITLAVLSKETALVFAGAFGLWLLFQVGWRHAVRYGLAVMIPVSIWQLVLWLCLGSVGLGSGGAMATSFEFVPLMGLLRIGLTSLRALLLYGAILGPLLVFPTIWALWRTGRDILQRRWHPVTLALFFNALVLLFLPHSSWREFLAMLRLSIGLVAALVLYAGLRRDRRVLNITFGWLATLAFLIKEGPVGV